MSIYAPSAAPPCFPFPRHRTMAEVMEVEQRIGAQRKHERDYKRAWKRKQREKAA
jgi:hypothetical protein